MTTASARGHKAPTRQEEQKSMANEALASRDVAAAMDAMARISRYNPTFTQQVRTVRYSTGGND